MDLLESLDHAFETLFEDVESRMHHLLQILLGKKSRWPEKDKPNAEENAKNYLRGISQFDPTPGKNYMMFITGQVAKGAIRLPEDGVLLKETLEKFMGFSRKANWKNPKDVMQYAHWRDLQKMVGEYEKTQESAHSTENILVTKAKEGATKILDMDIKTISGPTNFTVVKVSTPIAVAVFGKGTQWCTSWMTDTNIYSKASPADIESAIQRLSSPTRQMDPDNPWARLTPEQARQVILSINDGNINKKEIKIPNPDRLNSSLSNARNYLGGGPMYIIYKNNQPYIQMTNSARELRNVEDATLKTTSATLAAIFREMMGQPQPPDVQKSVDTTMRVPNEVSSEMVKVLTNHIKVGEANKARALQQQQQQQRQQPPPPQ